MKRFTVELMSSIAVLTLTSCSGSKDASPIVTATPATERGAISSNNTNAAEFAALQSVILKTQGSIEKNNFEQAKTEFGKFEESWKTVEDAVKTRTPKVYGAIEEGMDRTSEGIKSKNKTKALTALEALKTSVNSAQ